jgi:predicted Zn finger-like uncharacterized protein
MEIIDIKCPHCETNHKVKKELLQKRKNKIVYLKCKNCNKPILIKVRQ